MEYLELTAAINHDLSLHYDGLNEKDRLEVPRRRISCRPARGHDAHPSGIDYELLKRMAARTRYERIADFLKGEFDRVRTDTVKEIWKICKGQVNAGQEPGRAVQGRAVGAGGGHVRRRDAATFAQDVSPPVARRRSSRA